MPGLRFKNCGHSGPQLVEAFDYITPDGSAKTARFYSPANGQQNENLSTSEQSNSGTLETKTNSRSKIETDFQSNNERSKHLLESGHMSDICFIVEDDVKKEERIQCHKLILATRSRLFNKLFNGPNAFKSAEIKINDVKAKDFRNLLRYIYYDDTNVEILTFCSTFVAAEKYALNTLVKALVDKVKYLDGNETCLMLRQLECFKIKNKEFQRELSKIYQIETKKVIDSDEFVHLGPETLKELILTPILNVKEIDLFNAMLEWAKSRCVEQQIFTTPLNLKRMISRFMYLFRYKSMNVNEFASGPGLLRILSDSETVDLFLYLNLEQNLMIPKQLIQSERHFPTTYNVSFISKTTKMSKKIKDQKSETIKLKVDNEIYLKGVSITGVNYVGDYEYVEADITVSKVKRNDQHLVLSRKRMSPRADDSCCCVTITKKIVEFDYPVLIEPNVDYIIALMKSKPEPCDYKSCVETESSANVRFEFVSEFGLSLLDSLEFNKFQ